MDEQQRQVCNDRAQLLTMGFNITTFAYPHGVTDLSAHNIVTDCGYNAARVIAADAGCRIWWNPPDVEQELRSLT